jgi:hypothetical protein
MTDWRAGFLAMSAILGVSVDEALASMAGAGPFAGTALVQRLRAGTRDARARALAEVLAKVAAALPDGIA